MGWQLNYRFLRGTCTGDPESFCFSSFSWLISTATFTQRRRQRRLRAGARLAWHLHRTGVKTLSLQRLRSIRDLLSQHHSRDTVFLAAITAAMASQKRPPWRCIHCHVIMKGTFPRCWKCGFEWAQCADRDFVPPDQKQQDEATWGSAQWQYQNPKSPRTRSRRPSRSKHRQSDAQWQGGDQQGYHGGGGQGYGHMQQGQMTMPTMPPMGQQMQPMMVPYHQPPMMPPMMEKGFGKGMGYPAPMPPLPPPLAPPSSQPSNSAPVMQAPTWAPNLQMMPIPVPPAVPTPTPDARPESQAQKNLNKLLSAMKKEEDTLSPNLQTMAHQMQKKDERNSTQATISAAKELGDAKEALLEAENSRAQLLSQWKTFLQQSVVKWQEFTAQFQASEAAHQTKIQQARLKVKRSQRRFDHASKSITTGEDQAHVISDEEQEESEEAEDNSNNDEGANKIHEGMSSIVTSLRVLSESADQLEQRVKRPRKNPDEEMGEGAPFG